MSRSRILVLLLLSACSSNPKTVAIEPPAVADAPTAVVPVTAEADAVSPLESLGDQPPLAADTVVATHAGTSLTAPAGWRVRTTPELTVLESPERDLHAYVVDIDAATTPDEAVTRAWARVDPSMKRGVSTAFQLPGRRGWEEQIMVTYETSFDEHKAVTASVLRRGFTWNVLIVDGALDTFETSMPYVLLISQSLAPAGYAREDFKGRSAAKLGPAEIARIVGDIEEGRKAGGVPGVGLALIQDGAVVYSGSLGVRDLASNAPVTERTRFMIGDPTQALTTLMLAKLIDEGRFTWDTPVTALNPTFALGDPRATKLFLVKHLVCACIEMPPQEYEWLFDFAKKTPKDLIAALATSRPTSVAQKFLYSNHLVSTAGYSASAAVFGHKRELGSGYDELMRTRVFEPLGMRDTTFDFAKVLAGEHATPYTTTIDGKVSPIDTNLTRSIALIRPAGGAWSTVRDLVRYVQFELAEGVLPNGKRGVSEANILARREKQVATSEDIAYGMGLAVDSRYGVDVVSQGGHVFGYTSGVFWIPEARVGGVILSNHDFGAVLGESFRRSTLEVLYGGHDEALDDMLAAISVSKKTMSVAREHITVPPESAGLAEHYVSDALGNLDVRKSGTDVIFDFGEWRSRVASRHGDDGAISFVTIDPGVTGFEFVMGASGLVLHEDRHAYTFSPR